MFLLSLTAIHCTILFSYRFCSSGLVVSLIILGLAYLTRPPEITIPPPCAGLLSRPNAHPIDSYLGHLNVAWIVAYIFSMLIMPSK